jgi:hypothetical protein
MDIEKVFNANQFSDELFDSVNSSVSELRMLQKKKAGESAQAVIQALQKMKGDLEGKYDDIYAMLENRIARIQDGRDGMDGLNGRNGNDGMPGRDGRDGIDGINGLDGADGISIADIRIDFDNSLIITLSNGREVNAGEILPPDITDRLRVIINSGGGNVPAGSDTQIQYNNNGTFAGSSALTFDGTTFTAPNSVITSSSSADALRITQTGSGNALVVEDSASPDSTPFVIDASGSIVQGATSFAGASMVGPAWLMVGSTAFGPQYQIRNKTNDSSAPYILFSKDRAGAIVQSGDAIGNIQWSGYDGTNYIAGARITAAVDGATGTNDMPTRLTFSTTADGASSPTERMRIDSAGAVGIGTSAGAGQILRIGGNATGNTTIRQVIANSSIASDVTARADSFFSSVSTAAASFTLPTLSHFTANQSTIGAGSAVTNQYGFLVEASLIGATNNYAFYGNIPAATGRYNLYMAGTAANYFAGDMQFDKTVTASGTNGAQTINKNAGTVNFATAAASLVVTNSLVTANSIIICTVGTNDATMKSVQAVAAAGSFTLYPSTAPTAATRVNFIVIN